jgi:hypothetical protein
MRGRLAEEYQAQLAILALRPTQQRSFVLSTLLGILELRRAINERCEPHEVGKDL